jgi:hypothetical protein
MSWFERRRHRAAAALRGESAAVLGQPSDLEGGHPADLEVGRVTDLQVEPAHSPDHSSEVQDPGALPMIIGRAGHYVVTDGTGAEVGTILGDYVIGFTVQCWRVNRTFSDMESAMAAIAAESQARAAAGLLKAS